MKIKQLFIHYRLTISNRIGKMYTALRHLVKKEVQRVHKRIQKFPSWAKVVLKAMLATATLTLALSFGGVVDAAIFHPYSLTWKLMEGRFLLSWYLVRYLVGYGGMVAGKVSLFYVLYQFGTKHLKNLGKLT